MGGVRQWEPKKYIYMYIKTKRGRRGKIIFWSAKVGDIAQY